jgi:FixJ family two-component response regulator
MSESLTTTSKRLVVFVVDDEKVIATTLAVILTHAGFDAHALFCGLQTVEASDKL